MRSLSRGVVVLAAAWLLAPASVQAFDELCQEPSAAGWMQAAPAAAEQSVLQDALPPLAPLPEGEVPWCTSADDPRCAPVDSRHESTRASDSGTLCALREQAVAAPIGHTRSAVRVWVRSEARPGHGRGIERPPQ